MGLASAVSRFGVAHPLVSAATAVAKIPQYKLNLRVRHRKSQYVLDVLEFWLIMNCHMGSSVSASTATHCVHDSHFRKHDIATGSFGAWSY
jgi:hypothetical protein